MAQKIIDNSKTNIPQAVEFLNKKAKRQGSNQYVAGKDSPKTEQNKKV